MSTLLSKTRVLSGRQCAKRLWLEVNRPDLRIVAPNVRRRFQQGAQLNEVVHRLIPNGRVIGAEVSPADALEITRQHLVQSPHDPLFEATFSTHQVLVRADMFRWHAGAWHLTEVKSSTRLKLSHLADCAVQAWVIQNAGYPLGQIELAHVDTRFTYRGDGDYRGLLKHINVSEKVAAILPEVPAWIAQSLEALAGTEPDIPIGPQCTTPFACPFIPYCSPTPGEYPVTLLPNRGRIVDQLLAEGIDDVRDIPPGRLNKPLHERVRRATVEGKPHLDTMLSEILRSLPYPRYYLDFESIQFVVPIWPDTHPYEQLPFQWSCHVEHSDADLQQRAFLDTSGKSPLRACAETLIETLGSSGPIVSYSPFEGRVIRGLAKRFPDLKESLHALADRIVDLLPLIRAHYYHAEMRGSFSIKAVLPTVAPHLSYEALGDVSDGTAAQSAFEEAIADSTSPARREELRGALFRYCALDTLAMVELVRVLSRPHPFRRQPGDVPSAET